MPFYRAGDKVRIKRELKGGDESSDGVYFASGMEKYCGEIVTIRECTSIKYNRYSIERGAGFTWAEEWFESINATFIEGNVLLLKNGQVRLVHGDGIYLPNGTFIETENYTDRKHNFDDNFDIVEVHRRATGNYLFDLSGEIIQEEK